jgi:fructose-1-phosphate kinase PfkB-like protein
MDQLASTGIKLVVVSRGRKGLLVKYEGRIWTGRVNVDGRSAATGAIGSGDATVAGFCLGLARRYEMPEIIRLAVACGAANLLSIGPAVVKRQDVERLCANVTLREISKRYPSEQSRS